MLSGKEKKGIFRTLGTGVPRKKTRHVTEKRTGKGKRQNKNASNKVFKRI